MIVRWTKVRNGWWIGKGQPYAHHRYIVRRTQKDLYVLETKAVVLRAQFPTMRDCKAFALLHLRFVTGDL